jgi:hypothetical protein
MNNVERTGYSHCVCMLLQDGCKRTMDIMTAVQRHALTSQSRASQRLFCVCMTHELGAL